jgi:predicted transcriptional regulator
MSELDEDIFDEVDDEADELAMQEGEADAEAGRVIPHEEFAEWLKTWGKPGEKPPPPEWFE